MLDVSSCSKVYDDDIEHGRWLISFLRLEEGGGSTMIHVLMIDLSVVV